MSDIKAFDIGQSDVYKTFSYTLEYVTLSFETIQIY